MRKSKFLTAIFSVFALFSCFLFSVCGASCSAPDGEYNVAWRTGLFTTLSLSLGTDNGKVTATVRNDLTLGFATVEVYVYLYSSENYPETVAEMTQVTQNFSRDLNIFCSLRTEAETNGESKYWSAKVRYKSNADSWVEEYTAPVLVDGRVQ